MKTTVKLLPLLTVASILDGCGRTGLDLGETGPTYTEPDGAVIPAASLFVGSWICKGSETITVSMGLPFVENLTDILTFVPNPNGTLSMTDDIVEFSHPTDGGPP